MPMRTFTLGAVVARLLLAIMQGSTDAMLEAGMTSATASDVLLMAAIFIGMAERRPMTTGKMAAYLGIPRPTVARRLQEMMRIGVVVQDAQRRWLMVDCETTRHIANRAVVANMQHILKAAAQVSRLDTSNIAR